MPFIALGRSGENPYGEVFPCPLSVMSPFATRLAGCVRSSGLMFPVVSMTARPDCSSYAVPVPGPLYVAAPAAPTRTSPPAPTIVANVQILMALRAMFMPPTVRGSARRTYASARFFSTHVTRLVTRVAPNGRRVEHSPHRLLTHEAQTIYAPQGRIVSEQQAQRIAKQCCRCGIRRPCTETSRSARSPRAREGC